jgi:methyl-galactoside transport system ATP-binding protein
MAYVTEERRETGIFDMSDITFNTTIANTSKYLNKFGFLSDKELINDTKKQIKDMRIKTPTTETLIRSLSGGNQQKVIIGRWLVTEPDIFILDEPTRGIDVGAKYEIYELILRLRDMGKTVLMISSEMPELIGVTDRIMVMSNYKVAGIVETKNTTQEELMTLAVKFL